MKKKSVSTVIGAALATSLAGVAHSAENPFAIKDLANGYGQVAEAGKEKKEMKCAVGMCGAKMNMKGSGMMNMDSMQDQTKQQEEAAKQEASKAAEAAKQEAARAEAAKREAMKTQTQPKKPMEGKCAGMKMGAPTVPAAPKPQ
jgi:uncharacterized low-complexity protein